MSKKSKAGSFGDMLKAAGITGEVASQAPAKKPPVKLSAAGQRRSDEQYAIWLEADRLRLEALETEKRAAEQREAERRAIIAEADRAAQPKAALVKPAIPHRKDRVARLRKLIGSAELNVKEKRPKLLDDKAAKKVDTCIKRGAKLLSSDARFSDDGPVMGIDFGTSSIKIVLRWPFLSGAPAYAISVPEEMRSGSLPHLWQTVLWVDGEGKLSIYPKQKATPLDGFKTHLIKGRGGSGYPNSVTYEEAAIGCLALHIAYAAGEASAPGAPIKFDGLSGIHMAVPVATADNEKLAKRFEDIAYRAVMLAGNAHKLTLPLIRKTLAEEVPADIGENVRVYPELAAVVAGYSGTKERHMGPNVVVDCGAATLDIASFILKPGEGQAAFSIMEAEVDLLGAEVWRWAKANDVTSEDFDYACHELERIVFVPTQDHRAPKEFGTDPQTNKKDVQLIAVGGGMNASQYRNFTKPLANHYGRKELRLSAPESLKCDAKADYSRLLLADGLARQHFDIPEFRKPSEVDDVRKKRIDYGSRYIEN